MNDGWSKPQGTRPPSVRSAVAAYQTWAPRRIAANSAGSQRRNRSPNPRHASAASAAQARYFRLVALSHGAM